MSGIRIYSRFMIKMHVGDSLGNGRLFIISIAVAFLFTNSLELTVPLLFLVASIIAPT